MQAKSTTPVSFGADIKPLFRPNDIQCMKRRGVLLDDYAYMSDANNNHEHAQNVNDYLMGAQQPRMPLGGPYWSQDQLDLFSKWMAEGYLK
jgi:hypothetical protein